MVVGKAYRGKSIGKSLISFLTKEAMKRRIRCVDIVTNPKLKEANTMYRELGFKRRDMNYYRLDLRIPSTRSKFLK